MKLSGHGRLVTGGENISWAPLQPAQMHCNPGALTDTFGFLIQLSLGGIAFAFLVIKRYCEPRETRRAWLIWSFDTSKQIIASFVTHFGNVVLSEFAKGDPCSWYFINFLVDCTAGLVIIYLGLRLSTFVITRFGWSLLQSGEYGVGLKPRIKAFVGQTFVYCLVSAVEKAITTSFMIAIWEPMQKLVIWPHVNPKLEVAVVLLIVPFVMNVIIFWFIDNLLMRKRKKTETTETAEAVLIADSQRSAALSLSHSEHDDYEPLLRSISNRSDLTSSTDGHRASTSFLHSGA